MNVISYNDKDLQTLYNKYRMSSYYPNESMKSNNNQAQYTPIGGHNLLLNTSVNLNTTNNPLNNKNEFLQNIKPIPNIRERNRLKLLQESDKLFDDLELYGLILTNDLLKIRRLQQKTNKNDFSLEFNGFRKRLYYDIDSVGDRMVNSIKNICQEFETVNASILSYFKRILNRNTEYSSKLEFPLNNLKENAHGKVDKLNTIFKRRSEQLKSLKYFLYPPKIETGIVVPEELKINWDKRYERLKHLHAYRKLNNDLEQKLKYSKDRMNMMNKAALKDERERNMKYKNGEKKRRENQINFLQEQEQRELEVINEMDKFQKQLDKGEIKINDDNNYISPNYLNNKKSNISKTNKSDINSENQDKKEENNNDDEEEEEDDDVDDLKNDYTNKNTIKYPKSDKKSDISSIPAPSFLNKK